MDIKSNIERLKNRQERKKSESIQSIEDLNVSKEIEKIASNSVIFETKHDPITPTHKVDKTSSSSNELVCLLPENLNIFNSDKEYIKAMNDEVFNNYHFGFTENQDEEEKKNKQVFYKMFNISQDIRNNERLYSKFNPLLSIINKSKAKFNRKKIYVNFEYIDYGIPYEQYVKINKKINKLVLNFLNDNGYDNIQDFLSEVLRYEITHGSCYIYLKGNKLSFIDTSVFYSIVKTDGIYSTPIYYMPIISLTDVSDASFGLTSLSNIYSFDKEKLKFRELQEANALNAKGYFEYLKVLRAKDVVVCRYNSSDNKFTGYTVSPLVKVSHNIEHYDTLNNLRISSTAYWYTNFTLFKLNSLDIKSIKDLNSTTLSLFTKSYNDGVQKLKNEINNMTVNSNNVMVTTLVDKIMDVPKNIENRVTLTDEIDKVTNIILKELGIDIDFINSTNKRNEDVQTSELEDYFSSYIMSRQYLIEYIYSPFIKKVLKNSSIKDEVIDEIMEEFDITYSEFPVTIEEWAKYTATINNQASYASIDEIRNKFGYATLGDTKKDFLPATDLEASAELEQNSAANSVNQHPTKRNSNSTSKN